MLHHVEDPWQMDNEPLFLEIDETKLGAYVITEDQEEPTILMHASTDDGVWTMHFDGG
jgi:hypothetical protein